MLGAVCPNPGTPNEGIALERVEVGVRQTQEGDCLGSRRLRRRRRPPHRRRAAPRIPGRRRRPRLEGRVGDQRRAAARRPAEPSDRGAQRLRHRLERPVRRASGRRHPLPLRPGRGTRRIGEPRDDRGHLVDRRADRLRSELRRRHPRDRLARGRPLDGELHRRPRVQLCPDRSAHRPRGRRPRRHHEGGRRRRRLLRGEGGLPHREPRGRHRRGALPRDRRVPAHRRGRAGGRLRYNDEHRRHRGRNLSSARRTRVPGATARSRQRRGLRGDGRLARRRRSGIR